MSFNTKAVAQALRDLADGVSGVSAAQIGVPETIGPQIIAIITAAGQEVVKKATGIAHRRARYLVVFAYRLDGAETTAEESLMDIIDAFLAAIHADPTLTSTCTASEVDVTLADAPEYQTRAGKEFREFPVIVMADQQDSFNPNP